MAIYLQKVQVKVKNRMIAREKITEELTVAKKEIARKEALSIALRKKINQFLGLQHFSESLKDVSSIGAAASKIVGEGMRVLGNADECVLYLVDESRQGLCLAAASRKPHLRTGGEPYPEGSAFDQWALKSSQGIVVEDTLNDYRFSADAAQSPAGLMRCVLATPLIVENRVLGVVRANCERPNGFTADDLRLLDIFSSMGAVTLRNLLLYRKMDELATHDSLTGLYVNRHFQSCLSAEIDKASYSKAPFSVLLLDIDFFKRYNDEFGHSAGDLVLKTIAGIIASCLDPGEIAARYGGEEFAVILPGKGAAEGVVSAEKIRQAIQAHVFTIRRMEGRVTASIGVAVFPGSGRTRDELVWTADKNLYEAKKAGRNRVCGAT
jgi:diguanylate cyclase (GGDEF)-like protein